MTYDLRPYGANLAGYVTDRYGTHRCATWAPGELEGVRAWVRSARRYGMRRQR